MNIGQITTDIILRVLRIDPHKGLPHRGEYKCYLSYGGYDIKNYEGKLFYFTIERGFPRYLEIGIPDASVSEICDNDKKFHPQQYIWLQEFINFKCEKAKSYPDELTSVCFSTLHEFGHWEYFLNLNVSIEEYITIDEPYRKAINELKGNPHKVFLDYRDIPSEKAADDFAFNMLIDFMDEVINEIS